MNSFIESKLAEFETQLQKKLTDFADIVSCAYVERCCKFKFARICT